MYDAIIIGARCAGSPTAMLLARRGYKILLVDKACFPSDTLSTHIVWQPGAAHLKRWGLLERVSASNCPPLPNLAVDFGAVTLVGQAPPADGVTEFYMPRRKILDKILVDAAVDAGAELREQFMVQGLLEDNGRVMGIRGRSRDGVTVSETARVVIGADGMRSIVAQTVRSPEYRTKPSMTCWYYSYWSHLAVETPIFYSRVGRAVGAMPTHDGLIGIAVAWKNAEFHQFRRDIPSNFMKSLEVAPEFADRVRQAKREEPFIGTADVPSFFRKSYGPGWALVGDAAYHKDPITAQGISDAFYGAELLAEAIDAGLSGQQPMHDTLAAYERQLNDKVSPMYEYTCQFAALDPPPPKMQQLLAALRKNQADTDRFLGTITGTVSIPEFFAPENIARIVGS
jgi:flavin-dependent dehydrogenase